MNGNHQWAPDPKWGRKKPDPAKLQAKEAIPFQLIDLDYSNG